MLVLIVQLILITSIGGILLFAAHKIPVLVALPQVVIEQGRKEKKSSLGQIRKLRFLFDFPLEQKIFDRIKQTFDNVKKQSLEQDKARTHKKFELEQDYWKKVKKE